MQKPSPEKVQFHGDTIFAIERNGEPFVPVKPIIDNMGLSWQPQHRKLMQENERFRVTIMVTQLNGDRQNRQVVCIPLRKLAGFLATINHRKVRKELRFKILAYQRECDDALWEYWTNGRAVNHRQAPATKIAPSTTASGQALELLKAAPVGDFAKSLRSDGINIGRNRLYAWLKRKMYVDYRGMPYQRHIDDGLFIVRESDGKRTNCFDVMVTRAGIEQIRAEIFAGADAKHQRNNVACWIDPVKMKTGRRRLLPQETGRSLSTQARQLSAMSKPGGQQAPLKVGDGVELKIRGQVVFYDVERSVYHVRRDECAETIYYSVGDSGGVVEVFKVTR